MDTIDTVERDAVVERWRQLARETGQDISEVAAEELLRLRLSLRRHRAAMREAGLDVRGGI
jgi:protein-disulfide isomerase-like protein with CxxC motif